MLLRYRSRDCSLVLRGLQLGCAFPIEKTSEYQDCFFLTLELTNSTCHLSQHFLHLLHSLVANAKGLPQ